VHSTGHRVLRLRPRRRLREEAPPHDRSCKLSQPESLLREVELVTLRRGGSFDDCAVVSVVHRPPPSPTNRAVDPMVPPARLNDLRGRL